MSELARSTRGGISNERIAAFVPILRAKPAEELKSIALDASKSKAQRLCAEYLLEKAE